MAEQLHLEVENFASNGKSRRVTRLIGDGGSQRIEVFYEFDAVVPWSESTLFDGHVLAILLYAASTGKKLRVHGPLSQGLLRNMEELQLAWNCWKPEIYRRIEVIPDRIVDARRGAGKDRAITAFSGGVDATFTAIRHTNVATRNVCYPLTDVLMVHGFDVDVKNHDGFARLIARVRPLLTELNLNLLSVRTNSKALGLQYWEYSFGLELAGALNMLADQFQFGLIGSSEPYNALVLPWGSTPATDHLMSGDAFTIVHDGAGFSRTEKVAAISLHATACKTLKVCWEGPDQSTNCGRCEKCVRTRLNFLAAGRKTPPCFKDELVLADINTIRIANIAQLAELKSIVRHAEIHGVNGAWLPLLRSRIDSWRSGG